MSLTNVNPRSVGAEGDYFNADIGQLANLRARAIAAGYRPSTVDGMVGWITGKAAGHDDVTSSATRAKYRKILSDLSGGSPPKPEGRRHTARNPRSPRYVRSVVRASEREGARAAA